MFLAWIISPLLESTGVILIFGGNMTLKVLHKFLIWELCWASWDYLWTSSALCWATWPCDCQLAAKICQHSPRWPPEPPGFLTLDAQEGVGGRCRAGMLIALMGLEHVQNIDRVVQLQRFCPPRYDTWNIEAGLALLRPRAWSTFASEQDTNPIQPTNCSEAWWPQWRAASRDLRGPRILGTTSRGF